LTREIFSTPFVMPKMSRPLAVEQLKYDLTPVAGLALVGHYLKVGGRRQARRHRAEPDCHTPAAWHRRDHRPIKVRQRVGQHPSSRIAKLTPWLCRPHFTEQPLRSGLHGMSA
jgi:hypothetical protein